jgi:hypothetical protein
VFGAPRVQQCSADQQKPVGIILNGMLRLEQRSNSLLFCCVCVCIQAIEQTADPHLCGAQLLLHCVVLVQHNTYCFTQCCVCYIVICRLCLGNNTQSALSASPIVQWWQGFGCPAAAVCRFCSSLPVLSQQLEAFSNISCTVCNGQIVCFWVAMYGVLLAVVFPQEGITR